MNKCYVLIAMISIYATTNYGMSNNSAHQQKLVALLEEYPLLVEEGCLFNLNNNRVYDEKYGIKIDIPQNTQDLQKAIKNAASELNTQRNEIYKEENTLICKTTCCGVAAIAGCMGIMLLFLHFALHAFP